MSFALTLDHLKELEVTPKLTAHPVAVGELGAGAVAWIAELGANESEERIGATWAKAKEGKDDSIGFRAFVVAACWCSGQGRDFIAKTQEEIATAAAMIGKQDRKAVNRMYDMAAKLNGLNDEGDEKN